jgi:uncharacterized surface protein with fasciclin (FAS1) repeats
VLNIKIKTKTQIMKKHFKILALALVASFSATTYSNAQTVMVGGEAMYPMKNIVENAVNSKDHTTLVAAVKAAGLVEALMGAGPFTVFAPVNSAFDALPAGTVSTLLMPENKEKLTGVLTYHVIAGSWDSNKLKSEIKKNKGMVSYKTLAGGTLTFKMNGPSNITVTDAGGRTANISVYDVIQKNGLIHSIDKVLLPG